MDKHHERFCKIKAEWKKFISGVPEEQIDTTVVRESILRSWKRSLALGINPFLREISQVLQGSELDELLKNNEELIKTSEPFLHTLYSSINGSGFICALCDSRGYILKLIGDKDTLNNVKQGNFVVGALASEDSIDQTVSGQP